MFFAWDVDCSERKEFSMKRKKDRSNGITALYERTAKFVLELIGAIALAAAGVVGKYYPAIPQN